MYLAPLAALSLLLLVLLAVYWQSPKCPNCGALESVRDPLDSSLRYCRRCAHIYRLRP